MHTYDPLMPGLPVIPLMLIIGLCLVFTFVLFFLCDHARRLSDADRESLLPLEEERPQLAGHPPPAAPASGRHPDHHEPADHSHDDGCGCHNGERPPCPGCLKRRETTLKN